MSLSRSRAAAFWSSPFLSTLPLASTIWAFLPSFSSAPAIDKPTSWFVEELKKLPTARAMVHSKVVLIDPFSASPVVMTGSHNLGTKASGTNDENFLIIRDDPGLASAYATNIMAVYNQYRWRFNRVNKVSSTSWDGLKDNEFWQPWLWRGEKSQAIKDTKLREMDFWVGD